MVKFESFGMSLTYHMAASVRDIVFDNPPEEHLDDLIDINDDFVARALKPSKTPILLDFIESLMYRWSEDWDKFYNEEDWEKLLQSYNIDYSDLKRASEEDDYDDNYSSQLEDRVRSEILPVLHVEVFTLLFGDRIFLQRFNLWIAEKMRVLTVDKFPDLLEKDGVVKRTGTWNKWVVYAIYARDRNRCVNCLIDLSGTVVAGAPKHIDHIVPLKIGGTNDTANLQLLCETCNTSKGGTKVTTSNKYPLYWDMED